MKKILFVTMLALIVLTFVQLWVTQGKTGQKKAMEASEVRQEAAVGGAFTLIDQNGKTVTDSDFRGKIMLVSFGFTHCPDICPLTVSTLSKTMELLGSKADSAVALFISVDPARDTPAVMKDFLRNFDKHLIGLTGTEAQIKQVADAYKVYYARAVNNNTKDKDYNVDHSGYIYMMDKEGKFVRLFPYNAPEQEIAHAVERALR